MRGVDHIGITVPDLDAAQAFFTDILGCRRALAFGPFRDDQGTFMADPLAKSQVLELKVGQPVGLDEAKLLHLELDQACWVVVDGR